MSIELVSIGPITVTLPSIGGVDWNPVLTSGAIEIRSWHEISTFAAAGGNTQVTSTGHGLAVDEWVTIYGSAVPGAHEGAWVVTAPVTANTFIIATPFVAACTSKWWRAQSGLQPPELTGGPISVGRDLYDAVMKQGAQAYAETFQILIDGTDYTEHIKNGFSYNKREGSGGTTISLTLDGDAYSYLDHVDADMGKTVVINCTYRGATNGFYYSLPLWTGYVQSVETSYGDDGEDTLLQVMDMLGVWDLEKPLTGTYTLDATPYNCILLDSGGGCEVEESHSGNWNWLGTVGAGFAGLAGDSITLTIDEVDTVLVYGVDIVVGGTADITATNTAAVIDALLDVSSTAAGAVVTVVPGAGVETLTITTDAAANELTWAAPIGGFVSTTQVYVNSGSVLLDRRGIGGFMNPDGQYEGYWPFEGSVPPMTGDIVQIEIPAQTVDLAAEGCVMTGDDCMGIKTIYVPADSTGNVSAIDGACPSNGIVLATVTLNCEGQALTKSSIRDDRIFNIDPSKRSRGEILKLVMDQVGIPTARMRIPSRNDDVNLSTPIGPLAGKPFSQFANEFCAPSLWAFGCGSDGRAKIHFNALLRSPRTPLWLYDQNSIKGFRISSPQKGEASADVTIRGIKITNNGLTMRTETSVSETWTEEQEPEEDTGDQYGCKMGGFHTQYGATVRKRILSQKLVTTNVKYGNSVVLTDIDEYTLQNPLNLRDVHSFKHWTSAEYGVNNLFNNPVLMLTNKRRTAYVYENRLLVGDTYIERELYNPVYSGAYEENPYNPVTEQQQFLDYANNNQPGLIRDHEWNPGAGNWQIEWGGYAFKWWEPRFTIVNVVESHIVVNSAARKIRETQTTFALGSVKTGWATNYTIGVPDPNRNAEGYEVVYPQGAAWGGAGMKTVKPNQTDDVLMKSSQSATAYEKISPKQIRVTRSAQSWTCEHGGGCQRWGSSQIGAPHALQSGGANLGPQTSETQDGDLPMADSLEDDVERRPVAFRAYSAAIAALLGCEQPIDEEVAYVETVDQAKRLAIQKLGRSVAPQVNFQAPFNPALDVYDTVRITINTRQDLAGGGAGKRTYTLDCLVTGVNVNVQADPTQPSSMSVTALVDYNDIRPTLATRT